METTTQPLTDLAIRPLLADDTLAVLRAILISGDYGILLTDLDHRSIACNRQFGEIFSVQPADVVTCDVSELRERVAPLIPDIETWVAKLDMIYADPLLTYEDEQALTKSPPITVRRFTGPVLSSEGEVIGRLWTFRDITKDVRLRRMRETLNETATYYDVEPAKVYNRVVELVSQFYDGALVILSILHEDYMEFRAVHGVPSDVPPLPGLPLGDTYCQLLLRAEGPLIIQDASQVPECSGFPALAFGLSRYLGVPIYGPNGKIVGTLCFLDGKSDEPLDEEDIRFLSVFAMRIGAELSREKHIEERLAAQQSVLEHQARDLETTNQVLDAMNAAFSLVGTGQSLDDVVDMQLRILRGVLGYSAAGIFLLDEDSVRGRVLGRPAKRARTASLKLDRELIAKRNQYEGGISVLPLQAGPIPRALGTLVASYAWIGSGTSPVGLVAFGGDALPKVEDRHHLTHLEALVEQVSLLISTRLLQEELTETSEELRATQQRLVQTEKLSVVGTLAASTAHDIRNILSSISMELSFGAQDPQKALGAVRSHLDRFSVLSHRLLSYARPRLIHKQPVNVNEVLERVLGLTSALIRITDVQPILETQDCLPEVLADPHQIEHMCVNLVMNALQAMHEKGGRLTITTSARKDAICLTVADTGKGMTQETVDRLFEPFHSTRSEGFGLGLYSCARIVADHQGTIDVESDLGVGTTFRVVLPLRTERRSRNGRKR